MRPKKKTCVEQISSIVKHTTVEPSGLIVLFANSFASLASQTLNLDKACRVNLNLTEKVCDAIRFQNTVNNTENEKVVQEYVAGLLMWKSALQTALPCLLFLFVGSWMDLTGRRKIFMILPIIIGELFGNISNIINIIFFYQLPVQVLMFFDVFFTSVTGGLNFFFLAMYSYIVDITNENNRTHRVGILSLFVQVGMPAGSALSGIILRHFGYYAIYGTSVCCQMLNLCYVVFYLSDPPRTPEMRQHDGRGLCYGLKIFFNFNHIKNTLRVFCKKTDDKRFLRLVILLLSVCVFFGPMFGEGSIMYLSTRYRFNWDEVKFSIFQTYVFITNFSGTIITVLLFAKLLRWHDTVLGLIACVSKVSSSLVFCFAATGAIFYWGPAVDLFSGTATVVLKSMVSKQVEFDEIAKVNSVLGLFESLMPFVYTSMYTQTYAATLEVLPGAVFLLGAGLTLPVIGVFIWLLVKHLKEMKKQLTKDEENDINQNEVELKLMSKNVLS